MASVSKATVFMQGKVYWAKVLGAPRPNFDGDAKEWTFEFEPNEAGLQEVLKHGLGDRLKGKGYAVGAKAQHKDREPFLVLKKSELNKEGQPNQPIRIYDKDNQEWNQTTLIGNESSADVKVDIRDYGKGKKKGIYPVAIRVTDLVTYVSSEFGGMDGEEAPVPAKRGAPAKKDTFREDFGLDDPVEDIN